MALMLFNSNIGEQKLADIAGVCSDFTVLWDVRINGDLPEGIIVGRMEAYDDESGHHLRLLDSEIPAHTAALAANNQMLVNDEARMYLLSTDWYIIREMDSGIACPSDIKTARSAARSRIL